MITEKKHEHAHFALHQIFVRARFMAYTQEPYKDIARLLDFAERLPGFFVSEEDETKEFKKYLEAIAEVFPVCSGILTNFNSDNAPDKW